MYSYYSISWSDINNVKHFFVYNIKTLFYLWFINLITLLYLALVPPELLQCIINTSIYYLLNYSMEQSPSWEANRFSASSLHCMEPLVSLLNSQVPTTCPYPEPDWSIIHTLIYICWCINYKNMHSMKKIKFASVCVSLYIHLLSVVGIHWWLSVSNLTPQSVLQSTWWVVIVCETCGSKSSVAED